MNKFEKVSFEQYYEAVKETGMTEDAIRAQYEKIKLPTRGTQLSAGYDFFSPVNFTLVPGETIKIATGIRVRLDEDKFLALVPRSGLGFKYRLQLNNTIGIIDADYVNSDNEGHIFAKITNDSNEGKALIVEKGQGFMQGIILNYFLTEDDKADGVRNGGFGSTSR